MKTDGASLMASRMRSRAEWWFGGSAGFQDTDPIIALRTTDDGKTFADEGATSGVIGHMITSMDFSSETRGLATSVNALQLCSLLEYS